MSSSKTSILFVILALTLVACGCGQSALCADTDQWSVFSPPSKEITVLLPPDVKTGWGDKEQAKSDAKDGIERYEAITDGNAFLVTTSPLEGDEEFDAMVEQIKGVLLKDYADMKQKATINYEQDYKGTGWSGKSYKVVKEKNPMTLLVATDTSNHELAVLYSVVTREPATTAKVFQSLTMDPKLIDKKRSEKSAQAWKKLTTATTPAHAFGLFAILAGAIIWAVGLFWFIGVAFNKNVLWGLGCLFMPFCSIVFLVSHFRSAWLPYIIHVGGGILAIAGFCLMPHT